MQPSYQGRPLPRPDGELVDQGLAFDVGTMLGRRRLLRAFGLGVVATAGLVACAGTGNLFAVIEDVLVTTAREEGALPGIVRGEILRIAARLGVSAEARALPPEELARARAVFVTNSLRFVAPVTAIGARAIPSREHPLVTDVSEALRRAVAESAAEDAPA